MELIYQRTQQIGIYGHFVESFGELVDCFFYSLLNTLHLGVVKVPGWVWPGSYYKYFQKDMNQKLRNGSFVIGITLLSFIGWSSCSEGDFSIGKDFVESPTYTAIVDTFSLQLSTIKQDSVITAATGVALTGFIDETESGSVTAKAYFKLANTDGSFNSKEKFDSACLVMKPTGYYYGDTVVAFNVKVHLLTEEFDDYSSESLYNVDSMSYDPTPIGTKRYYPKPSSSDDVRVRMDVFGKTLFDAIQDSPGQMLDDDDFEDWIYGMVLVPDTLNNKAVIGYDASEDSLVLRLYTHLSTTETTELYHDFPLTNSSDQFNSITNNTKELALSELTSIKMKLPESKLNSTAILQGGIGYYTRVDFAGLSSMKELKEKGRIVKASLNVEVLVDSYTYKDLPSTIYLIEADKINQFQGYVVNSEGSEVSGVLDESSRQFEHTALYSFDVTTFLNAIIEEDVVSDDSGVVLAFPESSLKGTVDRMVFAGYKFPDSQTKLNVFYYYYDKE